MAPENEIETEETVVTDLADLQSLAAAPAADEKPALKVSNAPLREQELDAQGRAYATGRRKDAVARVWLKPGTGKVTVNGRDQEVFFARPTLRLIINQPFAITDRVGQYDVVCTVAGGGLSGQAGAVKTVGRATRADFVLDAALVSRVHCRLSVTPADALEVEDLQSTNGTWVNDQRVARLQLAAGDRLRVGRVELTVDRD